MIMNKLTGLWLDSEEKADVECTADCIDCPAVADLKPGHITDAAVVRRDVIDAVEARIGAVRRDLV